ncbi:hypothetical protein Oscil6304_5332 [Oscillatoria acuminata PCC 6304]|uniref:Uncharacterized protein n=1 Tax=Oscillatoria acuminata PCC 6304 TaxID=56110 RepID=K9TRQ7_9CYAN|nr:hypothetical protein Oscil6304_5332 [Oscillatoria acuminata PCC 6304]
MQHDWLVFIACMGALIVYLGFSALTEMGTKWPGKK